MILRDATTGERDLILGHTHALWSDGLEIAAYRDYIATLAESAWAKEGERNSRFMVLVDEATGQVLSAFKLYRFTARLDEELVRVGGVGAVFTPPELRRRGYAAEMISRAHGLMADRGDALSLLFSEIGAAYYARLGYRELPTHSMRLTVPPAGRPAAPRPALKRMHRTELDGVIRILEKEDAVASFALVRGHAYWKFLLARASYPTLSLGRDRWESRLVIASDASHGARAGYLWSLFGEAHDASGAKLLEFGETEQSSLLPALLDEMFEECRRRGVLQVEAWLPPALAARDPRLQPPLARRADPAPIVPMWLPLDPEAAHDLRRHEESALLHLTDVF